MFKKEISDDELLKTVQNWFDEEIKYAEKDAEGDDYYNGFVKALNKYRPSKGSDIKLKLDTSRNLYTVTLHKGKSPDQYDYLRWDHPVTEEQIGKIKDLYDHLSNIADYKQASVLSRVVERGDFNNLTGEQVYDKIMLDVNGLRSVLEKEFGSDVWGSSDKIASLLLLQNGIDGIKYPSEYLSKGTHEDSFNYVVFDENAVEIDNQIRFKIIGETGAANLDRAEEATTRMDNLRVAREMETSGKDPKTIRLATGWERGADGKWRYEVPDG